MTPDLKKDTVLRGVPLSGGVAVGRVCRFSQNRHSNVEFVRVPDEDVDAQVERARRASRIAARRLVVLGQETRERIGPAEAEIFVAQKMVLEDPMLMRQIEAFIREHSQNAEAAVASVLDSYGGRLREVDDEYLRERASDFEEIRRRLLDVLTNLNPEFQCASEGHCQRGLNRIVVTDELTPGLTMEVDTAHSLGFVTERGGATSHAAILARALGIPAVSGVANIHGTIQCGTEVIVDGSTGEVILRPSEATVSRVRAREGAALRTPTAIDPVEGFEVMANISVAAEADDALRAKADGIGLYRTEFEFMRAGRLLNEDEQYALYAQVVKAMAGRPVTFRLLDAGGDKPLPFLRLPREDNPALGWRGGRLLLAHDELLAAQARAMVRASQHGPVRVLYPMIVDLDLFRRLRARFDAAAAGLDGARVEHGVMFEVPSACLEADDILGHADFASVGTNDLIQFLFAVDRNNEFVAYDYSPDRPALWTLLAAIAKAARRQGRRLSVCGEMAGDPRYVARLMDIGIRSVSVSPRLIPGARVGALSRQAAPGTGREIPAGERA